MIMRPNTDTATHLGIGTEAIGAAGTGDDRDSHWVGVIFGVRSFGSLYFWKSVVG